MSIDIITPEDQSTPAPEQPAVRPGLVVNPEFLGEDEAGRPELPAGVFYEDQELPGHRVELFRVNGRVYTVSRVADPRISFRLIRAVKRYGSMELAAADAMYDLLGEAVVDALADEELAPEELKQVMSAVGKYSMSTFQAAGLGNS